MKKNQFFSNKIIIGATHFMPLPGFKGYPGYQKTLYSARQDVSAFHNGGVLNVIFENNYDFPHTVRVSSQVESAMKCLISDLSVRGTFGVSVLWNDYRAALRIAKAVGAKFVRVPVFVDKVRTQYGVIEGNPVDVVSYRERIGASDIQLFTDIHVKHSKLLSKFTLEESACLAMNSGSDGIIITGSWTGDVPNISDLVKVKKIVGEFPVIVGSGANAYNIMSLLEFADGVIVGTSLKTGTKNVEQVNLKSFNERVSLKKVSQFMDAVSKCS